VLDSARAAQHSRGKHENAPQEAEHPADGHTNQAKWKQDNPDQRIQKECEDGHGPTDHEQDAPQEEFRHVSQYDSSTW
jgi:hypothetical protein